MRVWHLIDGALLSGVCVLWATRHGNRLMRLLRERVKPSSRASLPLQPITYVISLPRRPAKRKAVLARLSEAGLERIVCFDAIDGRELSNNSLLSRGVHVYPNWKLESSSCRFFNRSLKWGEIGCALSHHAVWELAAASRESVALIVEDDVDFLPGFSNLLLQTLEEVEALVSLGSTPPPDLVYLARRAMKPGDDKLIGEGGRTGPMSSSRVRLVEPGFSYKTTAYILYHRGAQKLLNSGFLNKVIPVDDFLNVLFTSHKVEEGLARPDLDELFSDAPRLKVLAVKPQLARERRGLSDTENSPELA